MGSDAMARASSAGAGAHPEVTGVVTLWAAKSDAHECPGENKPLLVASGQNLPERTASRTTWYSLRA